MHKNICCDPSSELSRRDGSDEGSQHMVSMKNKKNYPSIIIKYSLLYRALPLALSTEEDTMSEAVFVFSSVRSSSMVLFEPFEMEPDLAIFIIQKSLSIVTVVTNAF